MKLTVTTPGERYEIESKPGGNSYTIQYCGCYGDDNVNTWECGCPAGQHGRNCKHMTVFLAYIATGEAEEVREGETFEI